MDGLEMTEYPNSSSRRGTAGSTTLSSFMFSRFCELYGTASRKQAFHLKNVMALTLFVEAMELMGLV